MAFKPLSYLESAVNRKNITDIRIAILSYIKKCLGDTQEIKDAINYIRESLSTSEFNNIWETHNGLSLDNNKMNWDKDYFAAVEVDLSDNFSKERFNHILEVARYVYGTTQSIKSTKNINTSNISNTEKKRKEIVPVMIVGGVLALVGIFALVKLIKK